MQRHLYFDTSSLNQKYSRPLVPLQGYGGGSLGGNSLGTVGDSVGALGWKQVDPLVKAAQNQINQDLKKLGYNQIGVDGNLGPGTCGGGRFVTQKFLDDTLPNPVLDENLWGDIVQHCQSFTAPTKVGSSSGGGGGGVPKPVTPSKPEELPKVRRSSMSSDTMWLVGGAVVAVAAVGTALYMRKKKAA